MSSFDIACPHCGQTLEADDMLIGETVNCPACDFEFQIPEPLHTPQIEREHLIQNIFSTTETKCWNLPNKQANKSYKSPDSAKNNQFGTVQRPPRHPIWPWVISSVFFVLVCGGVLVWLVGKKSTNANRSVDLKQSTLSDAGSKSSQIKPETTPEEDEESLLDFVSPFFPSRIRAYYVMNQLAEGKLSEPGQAKRLETMIRKNAATLRSKGYSASLVSRMMSDVLSGQAAENVEKETRIVEAKIRSDPEGSLELVTKLGWPVAQRKEQTSTSSRSSPTTTPSSFHPGSVTTGDGHRSNSLLDRVAALRKERERMGMRNGQDSFALPPEPSDQTDPEIANSQE